MYLSRGAQLLKVVCNGEFSNLVLGSVFADGKNLVHALLVTAHARVYGDGSTGCDVAR